MTAYTLIISKHDIYRLLRFPKLFHTLSILSSLTNEEIITEKKINDTDIHIFWKIREEQNRSD